MKVILVVLLTLQFLVASFYGLLFFRSNTRHALLEEQTAQVILHFIEDAEREGFDRLLSFVNEHGLMLVRFVYLDETTIVIYTNDVTLAGEVVLQDGRLPTMGTTEFLSNVQTDDFNQVGAINHVLPGFTVMVSRIENNQNFDVSGFYDIHTTDRAVIDQLLEALVDYTFQSEVWAIAEDQLSLLERLNTQALTDRQVPEMFMIMTMVSLSAFFGVMHDVISRFKAIGVYQIHGYSTRKIIFLLRMRLFKMLVASFILALIITASYVHLMGYVGLIGLLFQLLMWLGIGLILIYAMLTSLLVKGYVVALKVAHLIKGQKTNQLPQLLNHCLKVVFLAFFLIVSQVAFFDLHAVHMRLKHANQWELAIDTYRIVVSDDGSWGDVALTVALYEGLEQVYHYLSTYHQGFFMEANVIMSLDMGWSPYFDNPDVNLALSPNGYAVHISPNFLNMNPIVAVNGMDVLEQINWDAYVWNILVPEQLKAYEAELLENYLEAFYFRKVGLTNSYHLALDLPFIETPIEALSINIIYVESGQYYFTFDEGVRPEVGNRVLDPVAILYTGSIHLSDLGAMASSGLFFQTAAIDAYGEIYPMLRELGLERNIWGVTPMFDQSMQTWTQLINQLMRQVIFVMILLLANLLVTYQLISNYFDSDKLKLVIKRNFGYHPFKRNALFILTYLGYTLMITLMLSIFLGWASLVTGLLFIVLDVMMSMIFERRLMKKSFAEIMKGER
ncbi:MAG: DUF1430 domain-containing protein [Defluviitaleaceae bacterium]|nr:DUF1430 domain-containing protein [Defluviitaleaceae bacterium]